MIIRKNTEYNILNKNEIHKDFYISAINIKNVKNNCDIKISVSDQYILINIKKSNSDNIRMYTIISKLYPKKHGIKLKMHGSESIELTGIKIMEFYYDSRDNLTCKEYWRVLN